MAKQTYDEALRRLLADEGGYSNHPSDPGGPTNFGSRVAALAMADTQAQSGPVRETTVKPSAPAPGKGVIAPNDGARKTTTGIIVAAGGAAAAQGRDASTVIVILTVTIVVAIGAWLLWRWRQQRRQEAPSKS